MNMKLLDILQIVCKLNFSTAKCICIWLNYHKMILYFPVMFMMTVKNKKTTKFTVP